MPTSVVPAQLCFREGGTFLWNATLRIPVSASCRYSGKGPVVILKGSDWESLRLWQRNGNAIGLASPEQAAVLASDAFLQFWRARVHLHERISAWVSEAPPWAAASCGSWLRGRMSELPGSRPNINDRVGWHGTSLHYLERVAARGLEDGWNGINVHGVCRMGIYFHVQERAHLCLNYSVYSALEQDSGFLFAPYVQLRSPQSDPRGRMQHVRRGSGRDQELTYEDVCVVTDIWIHVRHVMEFYAGQAADQVSAEGQFEQSLEADPQLPRQTLVARAAALCRRE
jgi:hypothetical protein